MRTMRFMTVQTPSLLEVRFVSERLLNKDSSRVVTESESGGL